MNFWIFQLVNGLSFGMLLFLIAAGLALIYGVMRVLNLAHGAFYAVGAYVAVSVMRATGSLSLATAAGVASGVIIGLLLERVLVRRLPAEELPQALLTFGVMLVLGDLSLWIWGGTPETLPRPEWLSQSVQVAGIYFPKYRLAIIVLGAAVGLVLWLIQSKTMIGAKVRAVIDDPAMAQSTGINVSLIASGTFAFGAGLAAFGGVIGGPLIGVYPGVDLEILMLAFVVVIIGGLGSLKGAFISATAVGLLDNFGKALLPDFALFTLFLPMTVVLIIRPTGLFGAK